MAKITFTDLDAAFASTTALNLKFQQIEDEFTNKVLYRDEAGAMARDLDLGGFDIINVNNVTATGTPSIDASNVVVTPAGNIAATDAQAALEELDAEKALLAGDSSQAFSTAGLSVTGNISVTGAVDGRDIATDGTKLDTVETNADVTDATNVAASGAVMDSDISEAEGMIRKTGSGTYEAIKTNLSATVAPSVSDNFAAGYAVGSSWIDVVGGDDYVCIGDGLWIQTGTSTPGGVTSISGGTSIAIGGTASVPTVSVSPTSGTWTPSLEGSTTPGTSILATTTGTYSIIGDHYILEASLTIVSMGTAAGILLVKNLPSNFRAGRIYVGAVITDGIDYPVNYTRLVAQGNTDSVRFRYGGDSQPAAYLDVSEILVPTEINFTITGLIV